MTRKYLSKAEATAKGWFSRTDLKSLYRLKPAPQQWAAGEVWQGHGAYAVYDKALCLPMRPYRAPSQAQSLALERGRELVGTAECTADGCSLRFDKGSWRGPLCPECEQRERRAECAATAQCWLDDACLFLDAETTGLDEQAEVVEMSVIDALGQTVFNTLVRPSFSIPAEATAVHGIENEHVAGAPSWAEVHDDFCRVVAGRPVVIYNADYDLRVIRQTTTQHGLTMPEIDGRCAMHLYARWYGERREDGRFHWQKLGAAAQQCGIAVNEAHRGLADCMTTLQIINHMAAKEAL